jgi:hypothetical protein
VTYPADQLFSEVGYVAYHFHWPLGDLLDLEHPTRVRFVEEISRLVAADSSRAAAPAEEELPEGTFRAGMWAPPAGLT